MQKNKKNILNEILGQKNEQNQEEFFLSEKENAFLENDSVCEGQLLVDVYEKGDKIVIKSIVAGVDSQDLDISLCNDIITLHGKRVNSDAEEITEKFCEECYWGKFSRSIILPFKTDANKLKAVLKDGILTITIPKAKDFSRINKIKIKSKH